MGSLYLGGPTIQEVDGEMMMDLSIYGVAVMIGSLYSRFYGMGIVQIKALWLWHWSAAVSKLTREGHRMPGQG